MVACYTPSLRDRKEILHQLRHCRTFAYPDVMVKAADEIERMETRMAELQKALSVNDLARAKALVAEEG